MKLIEQKAENMSDLIAQLLFLSRADQGRQQIEKENVNLSELTEMIVGEQQFLAESKGNAGQSYVTLNLKYGRKLMRRCTLE